MIRGSKIIITRKDDHRERIGQSLRDLGAVVLNLELIQFKALDIEETEWNKITESTYQWLVFTSSNGVVSFFDQLNKRFPEAKLTGKIAVFGQRTAQTLEGYGYQPEITGQNETAVTLVDDLKNLTARDDKVLLLLGNLASDELNNALATFCQPTRLDIYKTSNIKSSQQEVFETIAEGNYDLIVITSPSSYKSLKFNMQATLNLDSAKVVCLGPTTQAALVEDGLVPVISAKPSDKPSLYELIEAWLNERDNNKLSIN